MVGMKSIIQFQISESDGGYVAEGVSVPYRDARGHS